MIRYAVIAVLMCSHISPAMSHMLLVIIVFVHESHEVSFLRIRYVLSIQ